MDVNARLVYLRTLNRRQLPVAARCTACGCSDPLVLTRRSRGRRCYECHLKIRSGKRYEYHHLMGGHDGPAIWVRGNRHRLLSAMQQSWHGSDLPEFARLIFGFVDWEDVQPIRRPVTLIWQQESSRQDSYSGRWDWSVRGEEATS